jgi:tetratricopeptide (TPR) repeat protein
MSAGDATTAEREFRALADAYPTFSGPLLNLGILQVKAGHFEDAAKTLNSAVERNANNAQAFNQLGIAYRKLGRFKDADGAYQKAVQIDPNYAIAYLNLGVLCDLYLQQPARALEAYERYLALARKSAVGSPRSRSVSAASAQRGRNDVQSDQACTAGFAADDCSFRCRAGSGANVSCCAADGEYRRVACGRYIRTAGGRYVQASRCCTRTARAERSRDARHDDRHR